MLMTSDALEADRALHARRRRTRFSTEVTVDRSEDVDEAVDASRFR